MSKTISKDEMGERRREAVHWLVEVIGELEMNERGRKIVDWKIKFSAQSQES